MNIESRRRHLLDDGTSNTTPLLRGLLWKV